MRDEKPSATALFIAESQLLLAGDPASAAMVGSVRAAYYRAFVEAATGGPWRCHWVRRSWLKIIERVSIPGIYLHYAFRKQHIEKIARAFLTNAPGGQLVVIAAGLDPLAAMLSREYPDAAFYELDHPATQAGKKAALEKLQCTNNVTLIPMDVTKQAVGQVLQGSAFSPDRPTLFIAEGITMYLKENEVAGLFEQLHSIAQNNESQLVFTYMNRQPSGSIQFENATGLVDWWLRLKREVFKWGIASGELHAFLKTIGWQVVDLFDPNVPPGKSESGSAAKGENICVAGMKESKQV